MSTLIQSCANVGRLMFRTLVLTPCDYLLFGGQKIFRYSREELEAEVLAELEREGVLTKDVPAHAAASGSSGASFPAWTDLDDQAVMARTHGFDEHHSLFDTRNAPFVSQYYEFGAYVDSINGLDQLISSFHEPPSD